MTKATRYPPELRERAMRLVREHRDEHASEWAAIESVAKKLGNTRAVCRKSYVHPGLLETYMITGAFEVVQHINRRSGLTSIEANVEVLFRHLLRSQRALARQVSEA